MDSQKSLSYEELWAICVQQHTALKRYESLIEGLSIDVSLLADKCTQLAEVLTQAVQERNRALAIASEAYEAGLNEYANYTNEFLEVNQDAWKTILGQTLNLAIDPTMIQTIDPRAQDKAVTLCAACAEHL